MSLIESIKRIFRKDEVKLSEDEIERIIEKASEVEVKKSEEVDPWREFRSVCKEVGADYTEVISKAAWYYLEDTGGVPKDPLMQAKEVVDLLRNFESAVDSISEPKSVKKLRQYNEALKEVAEFKERLKEVKSGKVTAKDLIPVIKTLLEQTQK